MTDRHKVKPMSLRFPEALSAWLREHSEATGMPVRQIVLRAVEDYRARRDGTPNAFLADSNDADRIR
jgi:hypothetical protein